jgi:hypothetical protein
MVDSEQVIVFAGTYGSLHEAELDFTTIKDQKRAEDRLITRRESPENFQQALERQPDDIKVMVQFSDI